MDQNTENTPAAPVHHAHVVLPFADGEYPFQLGWDQIGELEGKVDRGCYVILNTIKNGTWRPDQIAEIIRLGLIGGGMKPMDAFIRVKRYVYNRPIEENVLLALEIMEAGIFGSRAWQTSEEGEKSRAYTAKLQAATGVR